LAQLRIALVSEEFPPNIHGGAGTFCYNLASELSKRKIETTVFAGKSNKIAKEKINSYLDIVRLPIFNLPPRFVWFQLQNLSAISSQMNNFSIIHSITPETSPLCIYLKSRLNKPLITSYHGYTSYEMKAFIDSPFLQSSLQDFGFNVLEYPMYDAANRLSIANSDHIICCSHTILSELKTIYKNLDIKKASVIYNGIDTSEFDKIREEIKHENTEPTLFFFGRWFWSKGIPYLLEAFRLLLNEYPTLQLRMCGKGPMQKRINSFISRYGLENKVHLLGHVSRHDLLAEIIRADIVVLPSLREAQPISVLEAMACKKPVVAFDLPFAREYIKNSYNGLLAKAKDHKNLADNINSIIANVKLRNSISMNAYNHVVQNHNWNNIVDEYIEVYRQIAL
jgi:glycosyltransferase involved in cell wall biosynthesis